MCAQQVYEVFIKKKDNFNYHVMSERIYVMYKNMSAVPSHLLWKESWVLTFKSLFLRHLLPTWSSCVGSIFNAAFSGIWQPRSRHRFFICIKVLTTVFYESDRDYRAHFKHLWLYANAVITHSGEELFIDVDCFMQLKHFFQVHK